MKVILDTNIFVQDYHFQSVDLQVFFDGISIVPASVEVPEIVIAEVINRYREDLEKIWSKAQNARVQLEKILASRYNGSYSPIDIVAEVKAFDKEFRANLEAQSVKIIPYPKVSHEVVVRRDLARKKPFKRGGSGYRDFLIWTNLKEMAYRGVDEIAFITRDKSDFSDDDGLHRDLKADLMNPHRVKLFEGLRSFNEKNILPKLQTLEDIRQKFEDIDFTESFFGKWLETRFIYSIDEIDFLENILAGLPDDSVRADISSVARFDEFQVKNIKEMKSGDYLVSLLIKAEVELSISADTSHFERFKETRDFFDGEISDWASADYPVEIEAEFDLILDTKSGSVDSEELIRLEGPYGEITIDGWLSKYDSG